MKRRTVNVFSLSFIDCICCGLGAIILLFVIVNAKSAAHRDLITVNLRSEVTRLEEEVIEGRKDLFVIRNTLDKTIQELVKTEGLSREVITILKEKKIELADAENETLASKKHVNQLKADLKSIEAEVKRLEAGAKARDELGTKLRPFPGQGDRQYLTDLKMGGKRVFILVDASASMLDDTIVGIVRRQYLSEQEKLKSKKWRQAVSTIDWLTTQIPMNAQFQVYTFQEFAAPLIKGSEGRWLNAGNVDTLNAVVAQLRQVIPQKGTSLYHAFDAIGKMSPLPDNIFLLTDSLPTMGKNKSWVKKVSGKKRLKFFNESIRLLSQKVPVNIILYPMEGDPMAASAFWRLAIMTKGSFFCPSSDWP